MSVDAAGHGAARQALGAWGAPGSIRLTVGFRPHDPGHVAGRGGYAQLLRQLPGGVHVLLVVGEGVLADILWIRARRDAGRVHPEGDAGAVLVGGVFHQLDELADVDPRLT